MKCFDLFSGCGGFRLGFEKAGFNFIGYSEIDKWAAMLYKNYFNTQNEVYYNDATKIDTKTMPEFDILLAGFPCQSFSIAGKRKGFEDTRGTLFFDVARILKDKRPRYFVLENVKGLLSHDHGQTFLTIIKTLSDLGYNVEWALLNSKYFGVSQNRERVFIVGYFGKRSPGKIFPIREITKANNLKNKKETIIYWKNSREKWVEEQKKYVGTIKTQSDLCRQPLIKIKNRIRKLTPLECFRLQGFPDDIITKAKELNISDAQLYKMAGNSVTVNVIYEIAKRIKYYV